MSQLDKEATLFFPNKLAGNPIPLHDLLHHPDSEDLAGIEKTNLRSLSTLALTPFDLRERFTLPF